MRDIEKARASKRRWKIRHRDQYNASRRRARATNPEKHRRRTSEWYKRNPEWSRASVKRHRLRYPDRCRDRDLRKKYGITLEEKTLLFHSQEGLCGICVQPLLSVVKAHTDHCHKTGIVRGLLCRRCNLGIGYFDDDPDKLHRASKYLGVYRAPQPERS